ncbi:MAG: hypothetical protein KUL83_07845 [Lentimicrobium sp.]|jgi:ferredoxin|nr:hypothetical protein [Lentimicrobium sp.]MDD2527112.1 hypothetical protein [Lentimicrobiaceae bacterium]MDY0025043.1 hypothetical protein [Lentimicrobium sp.]HAH57778.1 hypothetical protein [Bacteroidales bacterium]
MKNQAFSPRKYLKEKGRLLTIDKCLIADNFKNNGLTICLIVRAQPGGKFTFASILVDRLCLGVKSCMANCNFTALQIEELIEKSERYGKMNEVDPVYFHNLVYAAIDYASELGFKTPDDFYLAEYVLDPEYIDDGIDDIEMGRNGKPYYIQGPYDDVNRIISTLNRSVGPDGYKFIREF